MQSKDSQESSPTPQFKSINSLALSLLDSPTLTSITGKTIALTRRTFVGKAMSLLFHMLSRLIITFLPRSKGPLISWLQSPSAVILEPRKISYLSQQEFVVWLRKLKQGFCINLEGWDGEGGGREVQKGGNGL